MAQRIITEAGIYRDVTIDDYHADKSWLSATGLKHAKKSMSEYRLFLDGYWDDEVKPHFDYGNAVELYLTDLAGFNERVAIAPIEEWVANALKENPKLVSPKASKTYKDQQNAFLEENEGKYIIPDKGDDSYETLQILCARCMADEWIALLLQNIEYQNSLYWIDKATGLQMKTRPDIASINHNIIINLKTATDGSPEAFSRDLAKFNYPLQAVIEITGVEATGLMPVVEKYFWLVLEKQPPFNAQLYEFDAGDILVVKDYYNFLLGRIKECQDKDYWPGYNIRADNKYGILTARIPPYYLMNNE